MIFTDHSLYAATVRSSRIWAQNGTVVGVSRRIFNNVSFNSMNVLPESSVSFVIILLILWSDTAYDYEACVISVNIDVFSIISFIGVAIDVTAPHIIDKVVVVANICYC